MAWPPHTPPPTSPRPSTPPPQARRWPSPMRPTPRGSSRPFSPSARRGRCRSPPSSSPAATPPPPPAAGTSSRGTAARCPTRTGSPPLMPPLACASPPTSSLRRPWPHAPAPRPARGCGPAATELAPPRRPCLLVDHPDYAACAAAALFVGASGAASAAAAGAPPSSGAVFWPSTPSAAAYSPERSMFWDADGAPRAMWAARSARARTCVSDLSPAWPALRLAPRLYEPGRRRVVARPRGRGAAAARHRRHLE